MDVGVTMRNMGVESTRETMSRCALAAESAGLESIWITDHIAIPPDDAEGSGGRYVDPLITLAWVGGATERIKLGTGVLILPYRGALATAKQVASLQELTDERLLLGVGIGWMDAEFRALGLDRHRRGRIADETLEVLNACFAQDEVELNGQRFLFKPRPRKPPIYVGGRAPHALERAARFGDGWLPMGLKPEDVADARAQYERLARAAGRPVGAITVMGALPQNDLAASRDVLAAYRDAGVERFVCAVRYRTADEYAACVDTLAEAI